MADPAEKLRRRAPLRRRGPARVAGISGDLFEHFGVGGERALEPSAAIVAAEPCPRCGWLCRADEGSGAGPGEGMGEGTGGDAGEGLDAGAQAPAGTGRCPLCAAPRTTSTGST